MEDKSYSVYKHTSPNNKVYIGITSQDVYKRWKSDGRGYISQKVFWSAINKYGWANIKHEVLHTNLSKEEAIKKEKELIKLYRSNCSKYYNPTYGYNLTDGGDGVSGNRYTIERRNKISKRMKGKGNPFFGQSHSEETKELLRKIMIGKYNGENNPNYGNEWTKSQKSKMSFQKTGCVQSCITKKKISNSLKGKNNPSYGKQQSKDSVQKNKKNQPNAKEVWCEELGCRFDSLSECARYLGVCAGSVSTACRHGSKCKGYTLSFINDSSANNINREIMAFYLDGRLYKHFDSPKSASEYLEIRINNIWDVLRGDRKTASGYTWKYVE